MLKSEINNRRKRKIHFGSVCLPFVALCYLLFNLMLALNASSRPVPGPKVYKVDTTWPGVRMEVIQITRMPDNRVMVLIRLAASEKAPASTLIGYPAVIPRKATKEERGMGFSATPFSLESSRLTDDQTGQQYPALPPEPGPPLFRPAVVLMSLAPGEATLMSVQFALPSPVPPAKPSTVSILLPNAKAPLSNIPIPLPAPAASPAGRK